MDFRISSTVYALDVGNFTLTPWMSVHGPKIHI